MDSNPNWIQIETYWKILMEIAKQHCASGLAEPAQYIGQWWPTAPVHALGAHGARQCMLSVRSPCVGVASAPDMARSSSVNQWRKSYTNGGKITHGTWLMHTTPKPQRGRWQWCSHQRGVWLGSGAQRRGRKRRWRGRGRCPATAQGRGRHEEATGTLGHDEQHGGEVLTVGGGQRSCDLTWRTK
jgi:hypothetical protein